MRIQKKARSLKKRGLSRFVGMMRSQQVLRTSTGGSSVWKQTYQAESDSAEKVVSELMLQCITAGEFGESVFGSIEDRLWCRRMSFRVEDGEVVRDSWERTRWERINRRQIHWEKPA